MNQDERDTEGTAISVGDGSLGGAAVGGSVGGPDSGVIRDSVGPDVAIPLGPPSEDTGDASISDDEQSVRDASMERTDPTGRRGSLG